MIAMWSWFAFWLTLHILSVMVAFGPDIVVVPLIAGMGQKHPQYAAFAAEVIHVFETKVATPVAVLVPLFGVGMIYAHHIPLWHLGWLIAGIAIYIVAFFFAITIQTSNSAKFVKLVQSMPPGPPPPGAEPPPEVVALGNKLKMGGQFLAIAVIVILILMVGGREGWFGARY